MKNVKGAGRINGVCALNGAYEKRPLLRRKAAPGDLFIKQGEQGKSRRDTYAFFSALICG
jgi:hypothetical protein